MDFRPSTDKARAERGPLGGRVFASGKKSRLMAVGSPEAGARRCATRKKLVVPALAAAALALWPASPAGANHAPCNSSDQLCFRIECSDSTRGSWWFYVDSRGLPHWDFSDCPEILRPG